MEDRPFSPDPAGDDWASGRWGPKEVQRPAGTPPSRHALRIFATTCLSVTTS